MTHWDSRLVSRWCDWFGMDGNHYSKPRWIGVIFYKIQDVKDRKPYFYSGYGGGMHLQWYLNEVNTCLAEGEARVTEEEVMAKMEEICKAIEKDPHNYCHIME